MKINPKCGCQAKHNTRLEIDVFAGMGLFGSSMPEYQTEGASGMDLRACDEVTLEPMDRVLVGTGLHLSIPESFEGQVRPRSGMSYKRGLVSVLGTIDSDYRGEIKVILINLSNERQTIDTGERIAQLVIAPIVRASLNPVDELSQLGDTDRGSDGFGSTGS